MIVRTGPNCHIPGAGKVVARWCRCQGVPTPLLSASARFGDYNTGTIFGLQQEELIVVQCDLMAR